MKYFTSLIVSIIALTFSTFICANPIDSNDFAINFWKGLIQPDYYNRNTEPSYLIERASPLTIKQGQLIQSKNLKDLIQFYPDKWIEEYVQVDLTLNQSEIRFTEKSLNNHLSTNQVALLKTAEVGDQINIQISYYSENSATRKKEAKTLNYNFEIIPQTEAQFPFGQTALIKQLNESISTEVKNHDFSHIGPVIVEFTINQYGQAEQAQIKTSSGYEIIDQQVLETIQQMPVWTPGQDAFGSPVPQRFKLVLGLPGC